MQATPEPESFTTIQRFYHPTDAQIAAGRLRAEGIPVLMPEINHASANWLLATGLGGIRLQVPRQYAEDAAAILAEVHDIADSDQIICPTCGSSNTVYAGRRRKIAFLAIHLFSIPLPWRQKFRNCSDCGAQWEPHDDD